MKLRKLFTFATLLVLAISLILPANNFNRTLAQQSQSQQVQLTPQQINQLVIRGRTVRLVHQMMSERGVPFEPRLLFAKNWRTRLANRFNQTPEMQTNRNRLSQNLSGVEIANELTLPEQITLTGDTVILARKIKFQGRNIKIKGTHSLHIFAVESVSTRDSGGSITIDTSGKGRREWLASRTQPQSLFQSPKGQSLFFLKASYKPAPLQESGQPGADGGDGQDGNNGLNGTDGSNGANGSCSGTLNGVRGVDGTDGNYGTDGGNAGNGANGGDGQPITFEVSDQYSTIPVNLISKGGDGGRGGRGGYGGYGGNGGKGGKGGTGASCSCQNGLGNGGDGGDAGDGGYGGSGGDGGNGGNGGLGGQITINYPSGYDLNRITTENSGGLAGTAGQGGIAGQGGQPGASGTGGAPGSLFSCTATSGTNGSSGSSGSPGTSAGAGGSGGNGGNAGGVSFNLTSGGGGTLQPGGSGSGGCTEWYLVSYNWNYGTQQYEQIASSYAGCW